MRLKDKQKSLKLILIFILIIISIIFIISISKRIKGKREVIAKYNVKMAAATDWCPATSSGAHYYVSKITTAPTCTKAGVLTKTCKCGATKTETIPAAGHVKGPIPIVGTTIVQPTCTKSGTVQYSCARCYRTFTETIPALGHYYSGGFCTRCGKKDPNSSGTGTGGNPSVHIHTWVDATCSTPKTCSSCGATEGKTLGHNYVNGVCTRCGELETPGVYGRWDLTKNGHFAGGTYAELKEGGVLEIRTDGSVGGIYNYKKPGTEENQSELCPITGKGEIKTIHIIDRVSNIGSYVFYYFTNVKEVIIDHPEDIQYIGEGAFFGCKNLKKIKHENNNREYIPVFNNLTAIGARTFCHCHNLSEIHFEYCTKLTRIGHEAFRDCWSLQTLTMPEGLKIIGYEAFLNCISAKDIIIPSTVVSLGTEGTANDAVGIGTEAQLTGNESINNTTGYNNVFAIDFERKNTGDECKSFLQAFAAQKGASFTGDVPNLQECMELIKTTRFWYYSNCNVLAGTEDNYQLGQTELNVKELKWEIAAKDNNSIVAKIDSNGKLTINGEGEIADYDAAQVPWNNLRDKITNVEIGEGITYIGSHLLYYCRNLKTVILPSELKRIGTGAFFGCYKLEKIYARNNTEPDVGYAILPDTVSQIGGYAFCHCHNLVYITIPEPVRSFYDCLFKDCYKLETVDIKGHIKSMSNQVFYNCPSLKNYTVSPFIEEIGREETGFPKDIFKIDFSENTDTDGLETKKNLENNTLVPEKINYYGISNKMAEYIGENHEGTTREFNVIGNDDERDIKLSIAREAKWKDYMVGQTLDTEGLTLQLEYYNGSTTNYIRTEYITEGFTCNPMQLNEKGKQTIEVTYAGKTVTYEVNVGDTKEVVGIEAHLKDNEDNIVTTRT